MRLYQSYSAESRSSPFSVWQPGMRPNQRPLKKKKKVEKSRRISSVSDEKLFVINCCLCIGGPQICNLIWEPHVFNLHQIIFD